MNKVCISKGNSKMGAIPSVSLPPITTCRKDAPCFKLCYAKKIARLRKTVDTSYLRNMEILVNEPERFWREVEAAIMSSTVFRFSVSGDFPDKEYLKKVFEVSKRNKHCQILVFTKRYEWVNELLESGVRKPKNLHIMFSAWKGLNMPNPYKLPECHIIYKDGTTTAKEGKATLCAGNCFECFTNGSHCFGAKRGDQILIKQH